MVVPADTRKIRVFAGCLQLKPFPVIADEIGHSRRSRSRGIREALSAETNASYRSRRYNTPDSASSEASRNDTSRPCVRIPAYHDAKETSRSINRPVPEYYLERRNIRSRTTSLLAPAGRYSVRSPPCFPCSRGRRPVVDRS